MSRRRDELHRLAGVAARGLRTLRREGPVAMVERVGAWLAQERKRARLLGPAGVDKLAAAWYRENSRPVAVVIPSYNDAALIKRCVDAVRATTDPALVQVVVVDDSGANGPREKLRDAVGERARLIHRETNGGFSAAVNTGLAAVEGLDVVVLNSDTVARPGWLESLQYGAYGLAPGVGIVGPKLLYPDSSIQSGGSHRNPAAPDWFDHYYRRARSEYGPANVPRFVMAVTGACMYIKADVLRDVGIFDAAFEMAFEDVDLCLRAWEAGYRVLYFPAAALTHRESATRGRAQGPRELRSRDRFWERWGPWFDCRPVRDATGRVRVIYVLEETNVAGGHRIVLEHLNRLAASDFACELYTIDKAPDWFDLRVPTHSFENYDDLAAALAGEEAIKVATWWGSAEAVWLASVCRGIPVYFVQDVETSYYPADARMQSLVLSSYRREFHYLTTSGANAEELRALGLDPTIIPCGIDLDVFRPLPEIARSPSLLVSNGRWHHLKNLDLVITAWRGMGRDRPALTLYGTEADRLGEEGVTYLDRPDDGALNRLLNEAAVYAQASRHEGFCLTILEAMAAGAVVVCTDADGNRDFCDDGQNCLMTPQDDPEELRRRLLRVLGDPQLRVRLARGGLETAARYSWERVTPDLVGYFRSIAERGAVAR